MGIKIGKCRAVLSRWKEKKNNVKDKITFLQQRLEWFQSRDFPCQFMIDMVRKELLHAYKEEDTFWRQKSRDKWLVFGTRAQIFFHGSVKANRSRNHISKLKDNNNQDQWSDGAKAEVAVEYFTEQCKSSNPRPPDFESLPPNVTADMNNSLTSKVSKEEVRDVISSINGDSAPGLDGIDWSFLSEVLGYYWRAGDKGDPRGVQNGGDAN